MAESKPKDYYIEYSDPHGDMFFHCHKESLFGKGTMVEPHVHTRIEMLFSISGSMNVLLGGAEHTFMPGTLVIIPSNEIHRVVSLSDGANEYHVVKFPLSFALSSLTPANRGGLLPLILKGSGADLVFSPEKTERGGIGKITENMLSEFEKKDIGYELAMQSGICRILVFAMREWRANGTKSALGDRDGRIFDSLVYIQEHFSDDIDLSRVAEKFGMSYSYFSRRFSLVTGRTFANYLCAVRLADAEYKLIVSDESVTDIAFGCGFSDASYFTRRFAAKNGISPAAFRKKYSSAPVLHQSAENGALK